MQSLDAGPIGGKVTPREIVSRLAPVDFARLRLIFQFLAANAHELKLETGQHLRDAGDWKEFLSETADALAEASIPPQVSERMNLRPRDHSCPECKHEHEDKTECKKYLGEGRFCPCETKVTV